jgi:5-carboxymethyl-2-hydroxymuconate isomerase
MPHFVIRCSENILSFKSPQEIMQYVYDTAEATNLFTKSGVGGIKVRINSFRHFITVNSQDDFIHIFAHIMEGRTVEQKKYLSKKIITQLNLMFRHVPVISINIHDFEKETYCNKSMILKSN